MIDRNPQQPTCLPAGRYEFKDAGIYIGEWLNEKAVGLGLITKDKCQGEYTGLWDAGMEKSGVFLWPNAPGAMYEGEWANNRRNGHGIFTREDWVIMGKFVDDFISVGVKCKENSIGRFEGEFENGFPSFGVETYADGGSYAGEYKNGIRDGLGVRTSIPYGEVINFFPEEAALAAEMKAKRRAALEAANTINESQKLGRHGSLLSQRSGEAAEMENLEAPEEDEPFSGRRATPTGGASNTAGLRELRMSCKFRCGFVLSSQRSELVQRRQDKLSGVSKPRRGRDVVPRSGHHRTRSLTNLFTRSLSRESIHRFKRQGSASERTTYGKADETTPESVFTLDQEDAIDPETVETFAGQWENDSRHGYGVCERSDGVTYEGQWFKNQRHGYGQTRFQDGTCEQGRYQYGKLVFLSWSKGTKPHMLLYNYHIKMGVGSSVKRARVIAEQARLRATEARENLENVHMIVELSKKAAELARDYSLETRELVKEMYPDFEQPGIKYLDDMVRLMRVTKRGNLAFESALEAAQGVLAGVTTGLTVDPNAKQESTGEDGKEFEMDSRRSSRNLEVGNKGSLISRAGSYRIRRLAKGKATDGERPSNDRDRGQKSEGRTNLYISSDMHPDKMPSPSPSQPLTLVVPQITNYETNSPTDYTEYPTYGTQFRDYRNPMYLNIPGEPNVLDTVDSRIPVNHNDHPRPEGTNISRSPSVKTTYVEIPRITDLHPESEIPSVPLSKLMTNTNLLTDHFGQYSAPIGQELDQKTQQHSPTSHSGAAEPHPLDGPLNPQSPSQLTSTSVEPNPNVLVRRRTVPVFLTQRPILSKPQRNMKNVSDAEVKRNHRPDGPISPVQHSPTSLAPPTSSEYSIVTNIHRDRVLCSRGSAELIKEEAEDADIYLVDEGVRKIMHPQINYTLYSQRKGDKARAEPPTMSNALPSTNKQPLALTYQEEIPKCARTEAGVPEKLSIPSSRTVNDLPVVSNVLLEEVQDELPALPTSFKESRLDLRQGGARYSVPNVGDHMQHTIPPGLSADELLQLTKESEAKRAEDLARRRQGEIVIHFTDLLDWCNRNVILLLVLLINGTLVYLFARLMQDATSTEGD
ncbi:Junctophilin-3 [Clonorchis sinensis]|uniref:Junctophilin-3 n=1 Tax=Clonorchis sinensis TaxID=79923 RepID=A0A3R7GDK8_CLOSI|nr:Junctophilin-3 [Clonorchis sinensis]